MSVVGWGYPNGERVVQVFHEPVDATEDNLKILLGKLPEIFEKLRDAIQNNPTGR